MNKKIKKKMKNLKKYSNRQKMLYTVPNKSNCEEKIIEPCEFWHCLLSVCGRLHTYIYIVYIENKGKLFSTPYNPKPNFLSF